MIVPQATMFTPRYFASLSRCAMYMDGKTHIKNPKMCGQIIPPRDAAKVRSPM